MTTDPAPPPPFQRVKSIWARLFWFWAKWMVGTWLFTQLFGAFAPVSAAALLLTLGLPIVALSVWGQSLDEELGWGEHLDAPR